MILDRLFGRPVYLPLFIDYTHGPGRVVLTRIYQSTWLLWVYKVFKSLYRLITGTTELYRICDRAVHDIAGRKDRSEVELDLLTGTSECDSSEGSSITNSKVGTTGKRRGGNSGQVVEKDELEGFVNPGLIYRIDRALLYSTKLTEVRRRLESRDGTLDEPLAIILQKKRFPENGSPTTQQAHVLRYCMNIIMSSYKLVHVLNVRAANKFDPTNRSHERKLRELWDMMMPNEKLTSRYTDQWVKIGFQGKDPATDFRGMGMLGLDNLHYYAKYHTKSVQRVLDISNHPTAWFSFAIVGINLTDFALQLVRTRQLQHFLYSFGTTMTMFNEFYCYMFDEFGKFWAQQPMITIMDFSRVFEQFQTRIQLELLMSKETVLEPGNPMFINKKKTL
ncbi:ELMO/CED-12 family-domain-containing protein [Phlyctochytrium arcticum]|nr:ELMO/CED-12 family-domain-containing protein [Phlyctochytrium arcticum]